MKNNKTICKKGVTLITVLALCFILLALGLVLMQEAFYHMGNSVSYSSRSEALNIAEYGVHRAIYELEQDINWTGMSDVSFQGGKCSVTVKNNFTSSSPSGEVPAYSILITSTGEAEKGRKKTITAIVAAQVVPYTAISEGRVVLYGTNSYTFKADSIPGFIGKFQSNYDPNSPGYNASNPYAFSTSASNSLNTPGTNFATSGGVAGTFQSKVESSGGTISTGEQKTVPDINYKDVKPKSGLTEIGKNVPTVGQWLGVKFKGKLKEDGGELKALCSVPLLITRVDKWLPVTGAVDALPDGMKWNKSTKTLTIEGNRKYYQDGDLSIEGGINLEVKGDTSEPSIYVDGMLKLNDMYVTANKSSVYTRDGLELNNCTLQMGDAENNVGGDLFTEGELSISTPSGKAPSGGNYFEGTIYAKKGLNIKNQCTLGGSDNSLKLEGVIIVKGNNNGEGIVIDNTGNTNFEMALKYNPYLANQCIRTSSNIQLQPLFWQVK